MPQGYIEEVVDIYQLPLVDSERSENNSEITIGDLHGNAMKLIFMIVKHGVARGLDATDYNKLVTIYKKPCDELVQEDLDLFNQILDKTQYNSSVAIRLIGDEFADRGSNDYFTLKILTKLRKNLVPIEVLYSNHTLEFIEAYERWFKGENNSLTLSTRLVGEYVLSASNLIHLKNKGLVSFEELKGDIDTFYKPTLKIISYTLSEDHSEITLFSHALAGLNTIKDLAQKFGVVLSESTATQLAQTIDEINKKFKLHVFNNTVHTLYTDDEVRFGQSLNPIEKICWNRDEGEINRPHNHLGYKVQYVHGHHPVRIGVTDNYITNLDNNLGKALDSNKGKYTVLVSNQNIVKKQTNYLKLKENIDNILEDFNNKIKTTIGKHANIAREAAITLHDHLEQLKKEAFKDPTEESLNAFVQKTQTAIKEVTPILQKDMGWGGYLHNLAKKIANVVYSLFRLNFSFDLTFFKPNSSDATKIVKELQQCIELEMSSI